MNGVKAHALTARARRVIRRTSSGTDGKGFIGAWIADVRASGILKMESFDGGAMPLHERLANHVIAFLQRSAKERGGYSTILNDPDEETGQPSGDEVMVFDGTFRVEDLRAAFREDF